MRFLQEKTGLDCRALEAAVPEYAEDKKVSMVGQQAQVALSQHLQRLFSRLTKVEENQSKLHEL